MCWARQRRSWNRSFLGEKDARQPERDGYLRTLRNLSNPSEVRSVLQLEDRPGRHPPLEVGPARLEWGVSDWDHEA